jgi:hypothetical protein
MNAPNRPLDQQSSSSPMGAIAAWVSRRWQAHRVRRMEEDALLCICAMDTKLLNDIGMDIGKLGELPPVSVADAPPPSSC